MEPVVGSGAHEDHRATVGIFSVLGEFAADTFGGLRGNGGDSLLPCWGSWSGCVVVPGRPFAGEPISTDTVLGEQKVEDGGYCATRDDANRNTATDGSSISRMFLRFGGSQIKSRKVDDGRGLVIIRCVGDREQRVHIAEVEIPQPFIFLRESVTDRTVRHNRCAFLVEEYWFECCVGYLGSFTGKGISHEELAW